jgi:hypothetical protein
MNLKGTKPGSRGTYPYCRKHPRMQLGNRCARCADRLEYYGSSTAPRILMRDLASYKNAARTLLWATRTDIDTLCTLNAL